jgi:hypothetical protein
MILYRVWMNSFHEHLRAVCVRACALRQKGWGIHFLNLSFIQGVDFLHPKLSFPPCPSSLSSSASSQLVILRLSPPIFFHIALFLPFVHVSCGSHSKILHDDRLLGIPFTRTNHHNRIVYLFIYLLAQLCPYLFTWLCNLAYPLTPHKRFISVIMCFLWLLSFVIEFLRLFVLSDAHVVEL